MKHKKQSIALFFAVMALFMILGSALLIAAEASHECIGESCTVCQQIRVCESLLKTLSPAVGGAAAATAHFYAVCRCISACAAFFFSFSLVTLRVKLSN